MITILDVHQTNDVFLAFDVDIYKKCCEFSILYSTSDSLRSSFIPSLIIGPKTALPSPISAAS